jgi:cellulose synthase/poly-beta-1,6-N-acetylglucosamine synthase-like glycosyltransferase
MNSIGKEQYEFGAVAIGRNEGGRLQQCLNSLSMAAAIVYVDSGSTDSSVQWARDHGVAVVELDMTMPFTAARARNAGFRQLQAIAPDLSFVQFLDGDSEMIASWPRAALSFLQASKDVGAVLGRRRERYPERSVYNWLCDREWNGPLGEVRSCGGDVMMRIDTFVKVGGYRNDLIAGEEPELCVRLRAAGWRIWRLDEEMSLHDAAITRLSQWWWRGLRTGYAFAQGAHLHGVQPERHWVWESRRAWIWGVWVPIVCFASCLAFGFWGWLVWLIFPSQVLRQILRNTGSLRDRALTALFEVLQRFPESWGQVKFVRDRMLGRQSRLIEYK